MSELAALALVLLIVASGLLAALLIVAFGTSVGRRPVADLDRLDRHHGGSVPPEPWR